MAAIFACIVQPKVIEFNVSDQKLHRAQKDEELRLELEALKLPSPDGSGAIAVPGAPQWPSGETSPPPLLCHPGGGCRLLSRSASVSVASVGSAVCVFEGALTNAGSLAEDFAPLPEDGPSPTAAALSSAELMCHMYGKVGVEMLGLLRGCFTFVLYESKTSRVLAARDGGGRSPLFQARTGKGSLVLSNSSRLLETSGCTDLLEVQPGDFKYGWSATPRRYQPASTNYHQQQHPHHPGGHFPQGSPNGTHLGSRNGSRRSSLDHHEFPAGSPPAAADSNGAGRHSRNHHNHHNQQQAKGAGGVVGSPPQSRQPAKGAGGVIGSPPQSSPLPPHRTYVVSAEDARIVKATPGQQQQTAAVAAAALGTAAAPPVAPSGAWTAAASAANRLDKDKGQVQENGGNGRGCSARGGSSAHHNRRRSVDSQGAAQLGAGPKVSPAGGKLEQQQQQQPGSGQDQQPQQQPKQQQQPGHKQQQQSGAPNGGRSKGRDGRASLDGRTPTKQEQQRPQPAAAAGRAAKAGAPAAPAAAVSATVGSAGVVTRLRVDAPEFVCNRYVSPAVAVAPAVVSAP